MVRRVSQSMKELGIVFKGFTVVIIVIIHHALHIVFV